MAYSKNWKLVDAFTIAQAAYLWEEREPPRDYGDEVVKGGGRPSDVAAIIQALEAAVLLKQISAETQNGFLRDCFNTSIRRENLVEFAKIKKRFPSFLFDTLADDEETQVEPGRAKNLGGRPATYDWNGFLMEIIRIADIDSLPSVQNHLVSKIQDWFSETYDHVPAESEIKKRISKIYKSLKDDGWKPKGG